MKLFTSLFSFYNLKWKAITIPQLINFPKHFLSTRIHLLWWSCTFVDFLNDSIWYEIWIIYISFNSFCNKEIEFQFESVHVHIWAILTNKHLSNGTTTGNSTGNPTGDSTYTYWTTGDNSSNEKTVQDIHIRVTFIFKILDCQKAYQTT